MADVLAESNNDVGPTVNSSKHHLGNSTTATDGDSVGGKALLPVEFVVVLVLAAACVLAGVVYAYVHITRSARARMEENKRRPSTFVSHQFRTRSSSADDGSRQTHLLFFKRAASTST